jgi:ABC-type transporter MlaC component
VPADTKMVRRAKRWLVYDVPVENIGLIANYRAQFGGIIRASSYRELVRRLQEEREE